MNHRSYLRDWIDSDIHTRWQWWRSPSENRLYKREGENWRSYRKKFARRYYEIETSPTDSIDTMVPVSICISDLSHQIEVEVTSFSFCPNTYMSSDFEDESLWTSLADGMNSAVEDPTILLHKYHLPSDECHALVDGILAGTASKVSDGSFNSESLT